MPPKKVTPAIAIETFAVKKRAYTKKKKVEAEPEVEVQVEVQVQEVMEQIKDLSIEDPPPQPPVLAPAPAPAPTKRQAPLARPWVLWGEIDWHEELGSSILYIDCKVAVPYVGKDMINVQYFTANAMNPQGALCLPHQIWMPGTDLHRDTPSSENPERSYYSASLHDRVIVRYEISRRESRCYNLEDPSKNPVRPGYHCSRFVFRNRFGSVEDPVFVILYKGQYVQLPRLMLRGIYS